MAVARAPVARAGSSLRCSAPPRERGSPLAHPVRGTALARVRALFAHHGQDGTRDAHQTKEVRLEQLLKVRHQGCLRRTNSPMSALLTSMSILRPFRT